ncbi:MAG: asparagine synthase (glutamine-hydrolyzing) [Bacteroidia bacterium]
MCGIVGITEVSDIQALNAMNNTIIHRGPDDEGYYHDSETGVAIGMRRLSIIDLEHGHQPISNEDESLQVVCNGEIYNSPELRKELESRGHQFKTKNSDVEVLLHLYEDYGLDMIHKLNGMYGFVIYDSKLKRLFGVRDRVGIKPLYYSLSNKHFAFSSELRSLLALDWVKRDLNPQSISNYFSFQYVPSPQTAFEHIQKIPAGHYFTYDLNSKNLEVQSYWEVNPMPVVKSAEEWRESVRNEMQKAMMRWTLSDVPIGVSLSGGIDSSALVGFLAKSGFSDIRTFSIGFDDENLKKYDELDLARKVSDHWGTKHLEVQLNSSRVLKDLDKMVGHLDEPYGGGLPSWYVYSTMADHVKVGMTGTGGDELFGNYGKAYKFNEAKKLKLRRMAKALLKNRSINEARDVLRFPNASCAWMFLREHHKKDTLFKGVSQFNGIKASEWIIEDLWKNNSQKDVRDLIPMLDFPNQLAEEFLYVTDRFSMAHSIEARVPFLDHELIELVMQVPADIRIGNPNPKQFLKDIVEDLIPQDVFKAKKRGFVLPLKEWTRGELRDIVETYLSPNFLKNQGILSELTYEQIVQPHLKGQKNNTEMVWTLLMFQLWYKTFSLQA